MSAVLFALLLSAASGSALEANADFQTATSLYAELEFEAAVPKLELASGDPRLSRAERAEVLAWLGLCLFQSRKSDLAKERFKQAVAFHHGVELPPFAPPTARALLEEVRAATPEIKPADADKVAAPEPAPQPDVATPVPDEGAKRQSASPEGPAPAVVDKGAPPILSATAIGFSALGAAAMLGVLGAVLVAGPSTYVATDPNSFQQDAIVAQNVANGALWAAGVLGVVSVSGLAVGLPLGFFSGAFLPVDED